MIEKLSYKMNLLAVNLKVLIVGSLDKKLLKTLDVYFANKEFMDITVDSVDLLNASLYEQFDIVIFSLNKDSLKLYEQDEIVIAKNALYIISDEIYSDFKLYINEINALLISPSENIFLNKIYMLLGIKETDNLINTKKKILSKHKDDSVNDEIDIFLDKYSGNIMFINDDLNASLNRLKDLEISKEVFSDLTSSLIQLSSIFSENKSLNQVSVLLREFSQFIDTLKVETIEPSRYSAFDYLTYIIEDLTLYIDELFIYKVFKDIHIIQDSMQNNITYFEAQLFGLKEDDNEDNLEFFV
ncbi:hypothetical protein [Sulfurimonas sp.]